MTERRTVLVEIGTEELPPGSVEPLARALLQGICDGLAGARVERDADSARGFATPRRVAALIPGVGQRQPDRNVERRGPAVNVAFDSDGRPTRAATGFAESVGAKVDELERVGTDKGEWLVYRTVEPGRETAELLPGLLEKALNDLPIPRRMRWGNGDVSFIRPVHWVVLLLGEELIESSLYGIRTGRETSGHRFHHREPVRLERAEDYEQALENAYVIADFGRRRERVRDQVRAVAEHVDGDARIDESLLDEVTALTEWPVAIAGEFDREFLSLPPEVITTTLVHHQSFFPVVTGKGEPTTHFVAVANIESRHPETVRQGYERVVRPRLADAAFFYRQDRKTPLANRRGALEGMQFQKKLGSIHDKSSRVAALASHIAGLVHCEPGTAGRAAELCKCDLTTLMVGEFPELQGVMGGYYAAHDGEPEAVSRAIAQHYRPRFSGDELPAEITGRVVAVADKLDTVCGIFLAGERPSGNKDPFALRRAAMGLLRILIEGALPLDLDSLIDEACTTVSEQCGLVAGGEQREEILRFFLGRLRAWYRERGTRPDVIDAVMASPSTAPYDLHRRMEAVSHFIGLPEASSLAAANKRIRNILRQAGGEWDARARDSHVWDAGILEQAEEIRLGEEVERKRKEVQPLLDKGEYRGALTRLAGLKEPVDEFFDHVMVMAEDERLKRNRLALLAGMNGMFGEIADISRLDLSAD